MNWRVYLIILALLLAQIACVETGHFVGGADLESGKWTCSTGQHFCETANGGQWCCK